MTAGLCFIFIMASRDAKAKQMNDLNENIKAALNGHQASHPTLEPLDSKQGSLANTPEDEVRMAPLARGKDMEDFTIFDSGQSTPARFLDKAAGAQTPQVTFNYSIYPASLNFFTNDL